MERKIINVFNKLDDKNDIFGYIKKRKFTNNNIYLCYKEIREYGIAINVYKFDGTRILHIFKSDTTDWHNGLYVRNNCITSLYNYTTKKGISEHQYSNRTDYYINNIFCSPIYDNIDKFYDIIENIVEFNTNIISVKYLKLFEFINSNNNIMFLDKQYLNDIDDTINIDNICSNIYALCSTINLNNLNEIYDFDTDEIDSDDSHNSNIVNESNHKFTIIRKKNHII